MSDDIKLFLGAAILVGIFGITSYWIPDFRMVAATQFGALVGAAAMKMTGNEKK